MSYRQINPCGFNPHAFVTLEIDNEGELAARDVQGQWTLRAPARRTAAFRIQRDFLGKCEKYNHQYKIDKSGNGPSHGVLIEIDVNLYCSLPAQADREQYNAKYLHDAQSRQMVRTESARPSHPD